MKWRVTLKDIAEKAGVRPATVSLALRNHPRIPTATRERIQMIARELDYKPDPALSALNAYRHAVQTTPYCSTLGFVTKWPAPWKDSSTFFRGAMARAGELGYKLEEFWLAQPGMTPKRLNDILYHRNIQGLIIAPLPVAGGFIRMDWERFSSIAVGYTIKWPQLHRVVHHQFNSMLLTVHNLRKLGYRRIGLAIPATMDARVNHHWIAGYYVAEQKIRPSERVPMFVTKNFTFDTFASWMRQHQPEVVIGYETEIPLWLKRMSLKIPQDIGFANIHIEQEKTSSGIDQDGMALGRAAVDLLVSLIQRNERGIPEKPLTVLVRGSWVDGESLKRKRSNPERKFRKVWMPRLKSEIARAWSQ